MARRGIMDDALLAHNYSHVTCGFIKTRWLLISQSWAGFFNFIYPKTNLLNKYIYTHTQKQIIKVFFFLKKKNNILTSIMRFALKGYSEEKLKNDNIKK